MKVEQADFWKVDALFVNPPYTAWGNDEDYMCDKHAGRGAPVELDDVRELWKLDELNELVNFYFFLNRESTTCPDCEYGYNPETDAIARDWYGHNCADSKGWQYDLGQVEVQALFDKGRLRGYATCPTADEINAESSKHALFFDAIDHMICTKARAKSLGVYGLCPTCHGEGYVYDDDYFSLGCQMWFLHPRKGAARGVRLNHIETEEDLEIVYAYLREAARRNADRFSKVPDKVGA